MMIDNDEHDGVKTMERERQSARWSEVQELRGADRILGLANALFARRSLVVLPCLDGLCRSASRRRRVIGVMLRGFETLCGMVIVRFGMSACGLRSNVSGTSHATTALTRSRGR
ncbi:hypothetical protein [Burkholderia diffusa]|uniref:hypothetical protein n=1 Tax=Burkholderia diffusa TaxID=488732 RepID=UPI0012DAB9E2|nr:hypothetical protein [Burkholderia diffusa]